MIDDVAGAAVARLLDRLAAQAAAELPDVAVTREATRIVLTGPGLALRQVTDARLRGLVATAVKGAGA